MENLEQDLANLAKESGACAQKFAEIQHQVASAIRQTADTLSLPRDGEGEKSELTRFAIQTRSWIESTASQIEKIDPVRMKKEFTERIQRNPGTSLLTAAAVGLVFGIVIIRRR
jgi:ElaB/YqjD/DUF883 family membrane-anchored ribosome-binding protein